MLHALEERGIYVSAGSACSSHKSSVSPTLNGIGIEKKYLDSTLRQHPVQTLFLFPLLPCLFPRFPEYLMYQNEVHFVAPLHKK